MTLSERIAAVMARVVEEVSGTQWSDGSREWDTHRAVPCVLWKRAIAAPIEAAQLHDRTAPLQRAILGKSQSFAVKIWGADWSQVDQLFGAIVRALEIEAAGAWAYQGDVPVDAGQVTSGEATIATFTLRGHVAEAEPRTVSIASAGVRRNHAAASRDGSLELGDP